MYYKLHDCNINLGICLPMDVFFFLYYPLVDCSLPFTRKLHTHLKYQNRKLDNTYGWQKSTKWYEILFKLFSSLNFVLRNHSSMCYQTRLFWNIEIPSFSRQLISNRKRSISNNNNISRWGKVFKNKSSKICGRQPLKNSTWSILEYFVADKECEKNNISRSAGPE